MLEAVIETTLVKINHHNLDHEDSRSQKKRCNYIEIMSSISVVSKSRSRISESVLIYSSLLHFKSFSNRQIVIFLTNFILSSLTAITGSLLFTFLSPFTFSYFNFFSNFLAFQILIINIYFINHEILKLQAFESSGISVTPLSQISTRMENC